MSSGAHYVTSRAVTWSGMMSDQWTFFTSFSSKARSQRFTSDTIFLCVADHLDLGTFVFSITDAYSKEAQRTKVLLLGKVGKRTNEIADLLLKTHRDRKEVKLTSAEPILSWRKVAESSFESLLLLEIKPGCHTSNHQRTMVSKLR